MIKINALLETYDVLISPHNMCSVITCAASLHMAAVMKNFMHLELSSSRSSLAKGIFQ